MSTGSVNSLSDRYLQSILTSAIQRATTNPTSSSLSGIDATTAAPGADKSRLSPFAQLIGALQQLQQSDPTKYQQVTQQIATNLESAAKTAESDGNTTAAAQLTQLATDFTDASKNGQLPNITDLAKAIGGHHHRHHHAPAASADASGSSSTSTSAGQPLSQLLAAFQTNTSPNDALDPMSIILNTLSSAGLTASSGG